MQRSVLREPFDRGDLLAHSLADGESARAHRHAVDVNGTGAALGDAAAILRSGEADILPDRPEQGRFGFDIDVIGFSVHVETDHCLAPSRLVVWWMRRA